MDGRRSRIHSPGTPSHSSPTTRTVRTFHLWSSDADGRKHSPTGGRPAQSKAEEHPTEETSAALQINFDTMSSPSSSSKPSWLPGSPVNFLGRDASPTSPNSSGRDSFHFPASRNKPFENGASPTEERRFWSPANNGNATTALRNLSLDRHHQSSGSTNHASKQSKGAAQMPETPAVKAGKRSTLHLLNPVNLLMRRRSGISQELLNESTRSPVPPMNFPQNYDPRIRGNVVHDFSAPRARRSVSHDITRHDQSGSPTESRSNLETPFSRPIVPHSPVFREHLDDERDMNQQASAVRAETLANQEFLKRMNENYPHSNDRNANNFMIPTSQYNNVQQFRQSIGDWQARVSTPSPSGSEKSPLGNSSADDSASQSLNARRVGKHSIDEQPLPDQLALKADPSLKTSSSAIETRSTRDLPRHAKSNASRFSFQLGPSENDVQEQLLEDRARQKRTVATTEDQLAQDEDDDYFDEDAMYDADELEGRDGESDYSAFTEHPHDLQATGDLATAQLDPPHDTPFMPSHDKFQDRNGSTANSDQPQDGVRRMVASNVLDDQEDDFYFDDGTLNAAESIAIDAAPNEDELFDSDHEDAKFPRPKPSPHDLSSALNASQIASDILQAQGVIARAQSLLASRNLLPTAPAGLEDYHNALAEAAQQAAVEGKFSRASSNATTRSVESRTPEDGEQQEISSPSTRPSIRGKPLAPILTHVGNVYSTVPVESNLIVLQAPPNFLGNPIVTGEENPGSDDGFDELINDNDIISEANAEALASDDDGFYGREFGFYAKARPGTSDERSVNGGFFGTPGGSTLERHHSVKEPNLTPITEHSEFSTRNSFIGGPLTPAGFSSPPFAAQLTLAQLQDEDLNLDQLLRLRDRAFAGSAARSGSVSSRSSAGPRLAHRRSWAAASASAPATGPPPSPFRDYAGAGGPHLAPSPMTDSPVSARPPAGWEDHDPTPRKPARRSAAHSRSASGGDSVAYLMERDEAGRERWILERRRTSEAGLVEVVGREVVQGGI